MSQVTLKKDLSTDQIDLLTRTICKGADKNELDLFIAVASRTGLDPLTKQIYAIKRWDSIEKKNVMTFQVGIDGLRLIAERTGQYEGQTEPQWCGEDGLWRDVWLASAPPAACKVGVYRKGFKSAVFGVVKFASFVQRTKDGNPTSFWAKMPEVMIAKVAESHALRKAFPQEMSGLQVEEETAEMEHLIDLDKVPDVKTIQINAVPKITGDQMLELLARAAELNVTESKLVESNQGKQLSEWDITAYAKAMAQLAQKETNLRIAKEQAELAKGEKK